MFAWEQIFNLTSCYLPIVIICLFSNLKQIDVKSINSNNNMHNLYSNMK